MEAKQSGDMRNWGELAAILNEQKSFVFSTHLQPDADGLGSELGLARYLRKSGKIVHIINPSSLRPNLEFLDEDGDAMVYDTNDHAQLIEEADVFIAFDIGDYSRLEGLCAPLEKNDILKISIDHHPGDKSQFDHRYDFSNASSTGILIFELLHHMDDRALDDYAIALPLYAAIMSDTGNFRFDNTDSETFKAAARLVSAGVKPNDMYIHIYENLNTSGRIHVLKRLLNELKYDCDGRLAWSVIDYQELSDLGVTPDDMNSLSDFIRSIKGVEVGVAITKTAGQDADISIRSKGRIVINTVAMSFGGGGHAFAAGCSISGTLSEATEAIVEACRQTISEWDTNA